MFAMWSRLRCWMKARWRPAPHSRSESPSLSQCAQHYSRVFGKEPDGSPGWIHFPFAWGTPESFELQSTIWKVEALTWKRFLQTIRDERIQGDLVEFGVSAGCSLNGLIGY